MEFANHLMTCSKCYQALEKFCDVGTELKSESYSTMLARTLVSLDEKNAAMTPKQRMLARVEYVDQNAKKFFALPDFEKKLKDKYNQFRSEKNV
jgi:hypothetical protein